MVALVTNGEARFCLRVRPPQDGEAVAEAVEELVEHLERCLDAPVTWWDRKATALPPVTVTLNLDPEAELPRDGFRVNAEPASIRFTACTPTGMYHAVCALLEEAFGVRWLWPGELGTVTPRARECSFPQGERVVTPDWAWRRLWTGGAFWREDDAFLAELRVRHVSPATLRALRRWQRRQRLEGLTIADGHRWAQICSALDYGGSHPEYFALVGGKRDNVFFNGKHRNQPCTSHPEVIAMTARHLIAQFRARPELDGFSLAVNDGLGFCECENCSRLDEAIVSEADSGLDATTNEDAHGGPSRVITDRMFRFANAVAEQVAEVFPDKLLLFLVYSVYRNPPVATRLHPNVLAQFCIRTWAHADEALFEQELGIMAQLGESAERLGIYDYYINGRNGTLPRGFARVAHRSLPAYHERGYRYFATQSGLDFATNGFAYYLTARALWATSTVFDDLLGDYCESGFGPAAPAVKRYLLAFMERWETVGPGDTENPVELAIALYPEPWRTARREELAEALAASDGVEQRRVAFLREGRDYLDRFCEASLAVKALIEAGLPPRPAPGQSADAWLAEATAWCRRQPEALVRQAVDARRNLLDWVDAHTDGYWISAMWFDYSRTQREPWLGGLMDAVEEAMR